MTANAVFEHPNVEVGWNLVLSKSACHAPPGRRVTIGVRAILAAIRPASDSSPLCAPGGLPKPIGFSCRPRP